MKEILLKLKETLMRVVNPPKTEEEKELESITSKVLNSDDPTKKNIVIHSLMLQNKRLERRFLGLLGTAGVVFVSLIIITFISFSSIKKVPLLWLVKDNGQILYMGESVRSMNDQELQQKLPAYYLSEFIKSAFTVSSDGRVQKEKQNTAYALTRGEASEWLRSFYERHNPYNIAQKDTITVEINYVYPSKKVQNFFTVGWTTTEMEAKTGEIVKVQKYQGDFQFNWGTHEDNKTINEYNPMGFFVESISMSKDNSKTII